MTDNPNRPMKWLGPLWRAMDNGMDAQANKEAGQTDPLIWRRIRAAEIRAVRDWLVPEEKAPTLMRGPDLERLCARQRLRALLTAEADRAERGDA